MLEERMIVIGRAYVKEDARTIREVVEELDDRRVRFNAFDLDTGKLAPSRHQTCSESQLVRWADREALPHEVARLHPYDLTTWFEGLRPGEQAATQLERAKAGMEQLAGNYTYHKW